MIKLFEIARPLITTVTMNIRDDRLSLKKILLLYCYIVNKPYFCTKKYINSYYNYSVYKQKYLMLNPKKL
jgi:hypothetical protein